MKDFINIFLHKTNRSFAIRSSIIFTLAISGFIFFLLSYTTGYYTFGEMNSVVTLLAILILLVSIVLLTIVNIKTQSEISVSLLTLLITILLILSAVLLLGDRMEGIGFTVLTQFDAGRGGEEASYLSFVSMICFLLASIVNIGGSFFPMAESSKNRKLT